MASSSPEPTSKRAAAKTDEQAKSSSSNKKLRSLFQGDEVTPLDDCLGSWVVVHDLIVNGADEGGSREIEDWNRLKGYLVEFSETQATICKDKVEVGVLTPTKTVQLPSGKKVLTFEWNPPKDETDKTIGYSDVWDFVKSGDWDSVDVSVEGSIANSGFETQFPLTDDLFEDDDQASKARDQLPKTGIIMLVHWYGLIPTEFGIKEFLYLCRPEDAKQAEDVLSKHGAYSPTVCSW